MENSTFADHAEKVALDRYSVIAGLVTRSLTPSKFRHEVECVAGSLHKFKSTDEQLVKVSQKTVLRWFEWHQNGRYSKNGELVYAAGLDALRPRRRSDCGVARALTSDVVELAERLRREEPARTTAMLITLINSKFVEAGKTPPVIVEATLARHLRRKYASRRALKREGRAFPRYERPHRNSVWQADWTDGIWLPDPTDPKRWRKTYLHAVIDDHSRFIVYAEFYFNENLMCLEDCLRKALIRGGVPDSCYWDNAKVYQSRRLELAAARLRMQVIFATPYHPEGKGKIERWNRTVQDSFYPEARRANISTLEELNQFFRGWLEAEYQTRKHSSTDETPRARWEAGADRVRAVDPACLVDLFLWEEARKVDKTGCIQIRGHDYPVHEHLVGKEVTVRYDPSDLSRVRIYLDDKFVHLAEPYQLQSNTGRKADSKKPAAPSSLASAERYRKHVSAGLQAEMDAALSHARPDAPSPDCLTRPELASMLKELLGGRSYSVKEAAAIADFFTRNAPLRTTSTRKALTRAVEAKGTDRHLRFYLDAIAEARFEEGA